MKILFIAEVGNPYNAVSSTDILTSLLLKGLKETQNHIVFFAISENASVNENIKKFYSEYCDKIIIQNGYFSGKQSKYKFYWRLFRYAIFAKRKYKTDVLKSDYFRECFSPDFIITHCGVYESILFGDAFKSMFRTAKYYQFWSDPMALSGILPDDLLKKPSRIINFFFEKKAMKKSDKIIYGTEPLLKFQKKLFRKFANKMSYIDLPCDIGIKDKEQLKDSHYFLYSGNFYKNVRNINPLILAFSNFTNYYLDIYGSGDRQDYNFRNVCFHERIPFSEMKKIENQYKTIICILNSNCIQIPGKIFYLMNTRANILVISDGKYSDTINSYLRKFNRFYVCKNEENEIRNMLCKMSLDINYEDYNFKEYLPYSIGCLLLNGGLNEN